MRVLFEGFIEHIQFYLLNENYSRSEGGDSLHYIPNSFLSSVIADSNLFIFKIKSFGACASNLSRFKNYFLSDGLLEQK